VKKSLFHFFIFCALFSQAQNPLVKMWDRRFGGMSGEFLKDFHKTKDQGFILGGATFSGVGGDKTESSKGGLDYWVIKIDSNGIKEWDKDLGGNHSDQLSSVLETSDNGYILGGSTQSDLSGDVSESPRDTTSIYWNRNDFWIVKIDSVGNKQWDKRYGGFIEDYLSNVQETVDKGFILSGSTPSGVGGDKTEPSRGMSDYWIIKTDSLGNKQWDKRFGGTGDDWLYSVTQVKDSGFILCGFSPSGIGGDKSYASLNGDYWIIKIDSLGNKMWDKQYGGLNLDYSPIIISTNDEGFIICGISWSGIGADKTEAVYDTCIVCLGNVRGDFWIVKIDSAGNKQWDRDFGGVNGEDEVGSIVQTSDSGYLITGTSYSNAGGSKSEDNLGNEQTWVIKTDSLGIKQWDKTIFTRTISDDEIGFAVQTQGNCYQIANYTNADTGGYKTQFNWSSPTANFWTVRFCDSTSLLPIAIAFTDNFLCPGTCTDFSNTSVYATFYQWNFPGAVPDTSTTPNPTNICYANAGSYDVQLIATNANGSDTLLLTNYITVYPTPPAQAITQSGDTLFAIAGSATYQWYFNGNPVNGATDYFYVVTASGDYNVVATDANGCEVEAAIFSVLASAQTAVGNLQLAIFPNPVGDQFTIHNAQLAIGTAVEISIYNMIAEKVYSADYCGLPTVDCRLLSPGMYYLEVTSSGKVFRKKFVKK
jgi:hypothetical protein